MYDIENNTLVKEIHPDFQHPLFAYFHPMHLIDVKNGHILFSQRLDYESTIYNQNLEVLYSIKRHSVPWMRMKQKNIDKIVNKYPRNEAGCIIAAVEKYLPKINQQLWTYFIDTNKILCVYQSPNVENKLYANTKVDIWEKKDSSWIITRESIIDFIEIITNEDSIIHNKSFGLAFTSGDKYIFTASNIIILKNKSSNIYPLGMKLSDNRSKSNAYFLKNDPILSVYIFSHTF